MTKPPQMPVVLPIDTTNGQEIATFTFGSEKRSKTSEDLDSLQPQSAPDRSIRFTKLPNIQNPINFCPVWDNSAI